MTAPAHFSTSISARTTSRHSAWKRKICFPGLIENVMRKKTEKRKCQEMPTGSGAKWLTKNASSQSLGNTASRTSKHIVLKRES